MKLVYQTVCLFMLLMLGCSQQSPKPVAKTNRTTAQKSTATKTGATPATSNKLLNSAPLAAAGPAEPDALQQASDYIAALQAGNLKAAALTPEFKKLIAPPRTDAEKQLGYSDWGAEVWLQEQTKGISNEQLEGLKLNSTTTLLSSKSAQGEGNNRRALLRLIKQDMNYLIDWVHVVENISEFNYTEAPAPAFTALAFLDSVMARQIRLCQSLIAPAYARNIAPPLDDADKELGYNPGILTIKLNNFRGAATSAEQLSFAKTGDGYTLTGQLVGMGELRPFAIAVVPVGANWLVNSFDPN